MPCHPQKLLAGADNAAGALNRGDFPAAIRLIGGMRREDLSHLPTPCALKVRELLDLLEKAATAGRRLDHRYEQPEFDRLLKAAELACDTSANLIDERV